MKKSNKNILEKEGSIISLRIFVPFNFELDGYDIEYKTSENNFVELKKVDLKYISDFKTINSLETLTISSDIENDSADHVIELLQNNENIKNLNICGSYDSLNDYIYEILQSKNIRNLKFSCSNDDNAFVEAIAEGLKNNEYIDSLEFDECFGLGKKNIIPLFETLSLNDNNLKKITIQDCDLGDESVIHIGRFLISSKCKVSRLDFSENNINDKGATCIANALLYQSHNNKVSDLDLSHNKINNKGGNAFLKLLKNKIKYLKLDNIRLDNNNIDTKILNEIEDLLDNAKILSKSLPSDVKTGEISNIDSDPLNNTHANYVDHNLIGNSSKISDFVQDSSIE